MGHSVARLPIAGALVAIVAIACSGSSTTTSNGGKIYCQKDPLGGACKCSNVDEQEAGWDYVSSCDSLPSGSACCYDVNGDGETTGCDCVVPHCATDTDTSECYCQHFLFVVVGKVQDNEKLVSSCGGRCCKSATDCKCTGSSVGFFCSSDNQEVSSCTAPTTYACPSGTKQATSCNGLKWKAR